MKKQLLVIMMMLLTAVANAQSEFVEIGNLWYSIHPESNNIAIVSPSQGAPYEGEIVVPASFEYGGVIYTVYSIGWGAFDNCSGLTAITIPNGVVSIADYAFRNCSGLTTISIPSSVTFIGLCAFGGCVNLMSMDIPSALSTIGNAAFENCIGLKTIHIPANVVSIGNLAFMGCSTLESITVSAENTVYDSRDNCNAIINTSTNELLFGCRNTIIPNSVISIAYAAFLGCSGMTTLRIPNSVTKLGTSSFANCSDLATIILGNGIMLIGDNSFYNCPSMKDFYCYAEQKPKAPGDPWSTAKQATLHVPKNLISDYSLQYPWTAFSSIIALTDDDPKPEIGAKKCATPTISLVGDELQFSCETEDVEYQWEIAIDEVQKGTSSKVSLTGVYRVSVYATKAGYENSDVVTEEIKLGGGGIGDVNGDGVIDVADVVAVVNIILKGGNANSPEAKAHARAYLKAHGFIVP